MRRRPKQPLVFCACCSFFLVITTSVLLLLGFGESAPTTSAFVPIMSTASAASTEHNKHVASSRTTATTKRRRIACEAVVDGGDNSQEASVNGGGNNNTSNQHDTSAAAAAAGRLERLKQKEAELAAQLAAVRREKLSALRSRPLTIGIVGFGRFGQFIAKTFSKYGNVVVTSRSDYSALAETLGCAYVPLSDPAAFLAHELDVIVIAVSILSFEATVRALAPHLQARASCAAAQQQQPQQQGTETTAAAAPAPPALQLLHAPLIVDVLSVKEHARKVMLRHLPPECDILCTHPMFGPDSGKDGWYGLNFVYEKTRIDQVVLSDQQQQRQRRTSTTSVGSSSSQQQEAFVDQAGAVHSIHEDSEVHVEGMDRMERFLSIWEEEGCRMVPLSCADHDAYAANSQFITHLVGRVLGSQGLQETPIDTSGFQSVLKLIGSTTADSFDLFYGLYKYNQNSLETIRQLQTAMNDVVQNLQTQEQIELEQKWKTQHQEETTNESSSQQQQKSSDTSAAPTQEQQPRAAPSS